MDSLIKASNYALLEGDRDGLSALLGEDQDSVEAIWLKAQGCADEVKRLTLLQKVVEFQNPEFSPLAGEILQREKELQQQIDRPPGWQFWKKPGWLPTVQFISRYRIYMILLFIAVCIAAIVSLPRIFSGQQNNLPSAVMLTATQMAEQNAVAFSAEISPTLTHPTVTLQPTPSITAIPASKRSTVAYPAGQLSLMRIEYPTDRLVSFQGGGSEDFATPAVGAVFTAFELEFTCNLTLCDNPPQAVISMKLDDGAIIEYEQYSQPVIVDQPAIARVSAGQSVSGWFVFEIPTQRSPAKLIVSPLDESAPMELTIDFK